MKSRKEALCYKTVVEFRLCTKRAAFFVRFILWQMVWGALACGLRSLHELVMERSQEFDKEERLLLCLSLLLQRYGQPFEQCVPECRDEIERACAFMEQNYAGRICLDQICRCAGLSRSTLLRAFAKAKGGHALPLPGKHSDRRGEKTAGTRRGSCGSRHADRFFGPEPFYQLFQPVHRPVPRGIPGHIPEKRGRKR